MADKSIGELKKAAQLDNESLLPVEQSGEAMSISGALIRRFAEEAGDAAGRAAVTNDVKLAAGHAEAAGLAQQNAAVSENNAKNSAAKAKSSEDAAAGNAANAATSAESAAKSADKAVQYSGNPPRPIGGTWWVWNATTGGYEDTGIQSVLTIVKSYGSVAEMEADVANHTEGDLVIIASDVEMDENSRLYVHTGTGWRFLSDLSGIQGPPGKSAYDVAKENGYDGTEETFWQDLATFKESVNAAIAAAQAAKESENSSAQNAQNAEASAQNASNSAGSAAASESAAKTAETNAKAAQAAAEAARDEAQNIVGGELMLRSIYDPQEKGTDVFAYADTKAPMYSYGTEDLIAGESPLEAGKLYFRYV